MHRRVRAGARSYRDRVLRVGEPRIVGGVPKPNFEGDDDARLYLMVTVKPVSAR